MVVIESVAVAVLFFFVVRAVLFSERLRWWSTAYFSTKPITTSAVVVGFVSAVQRASVYEAAVTAAATVFVLALLAVVEHLGDWLFLRVVNDR